MQGLTATCFEAPLPYLLRLAKLVSNRSIQQANDMNDLCVVSVKNLEHEVPHLSDFISDMIYKFRFQTLNSSHLPLLRPALNIANVCFFKFYRSQKETTEQPPQDSRESLT